MSNNLLHNTLSNKYQKKSDKQHVLDNPDTYIGSVENIKLYCFLTPRQLGTLGSKSHLCLLHSCNYVFFSVKKLYLIEYSISHLNFKNLRWVYELM